MGFIKGKNGKFYYNGIGAAHLFSNNVEWSINPTVDEVENTVKGQDVKTYEGGLGEPGSLSIRCLSDPTAGKQREVKSAIFSGVVTASAFILLEDSTTGYSGSAIPVNYGVTSPAGSELNTAEYTFKITGAITGSY